MEEENLNNLSMDDAASALNPDQDINNPMSAGFNNVDSIATPNNQKNIAQSSNVAPPEESNILPVSNNVTSDDAMNTDNFGPRASISQANITQRPPGQIGDSFHKSVFEVTDNYIPHRGIPWYVCFVIVFMVSSALVVFFADWAILFVLVAAASVLLWRGHQGVRMNLEVTEKAIIIQNKTFMFDKINSFYISPIGDHLALHIILMKKYVPKLTFIFFNHDDADEVCRKMDPYVPFQGLKDESYIDLLIHRLKL